MSDENKDTFAVVEMLGHRVLAGRVQECKRFGAEGVLVDVPAVEGAPAWQVFVGGPSLYAVTPCTETQALSYLKRNFVRPPQYLTLPGPGEPAALLPPSGPSDQEIIESEDRQVGELIDAAEEVVLCWDFDAADPGPVGGVAMNNAMVVLREKLLALGIGIERERESDPEPEAEYPDDDEDDWDDDED